MSLPSFDVLQRPKEGHHALCLLIVQLQLQDEIEERYFRSL